jgi:hypothetical protein
LWGGGLEEKKLRWIKWDHICLPKEKAGLGVKNLQLFNSALLGKWKWRFLNDEAAIWTELFRYRYGHFPSLLMGDQEMIINLNSSIWWRDILGPSRGSFEGWLKSNVRCCVGNGNNVEFWNFKWLEINLFVLFSQSCMLKNLVKIQRFPRKWRTLFGGQGPPITDLLLTIATLVAKKHY